jgi:uncharacterized membrane protein
VKLKILIGMLVFLIVVNLATIGSYIFFRVQHKPTEFVPDFPGRFPRPPHLNLDREQIHQMLELRRDFQNDVRELSEEIAKIREEIYQNLKQDPVPMNAVEEKLQKVATLRMQIERIAIKRLVEAGNYLSPEQVDNLYRFLLMESPRQMGIGLRGRPIIPRDRDQFRDFNNKK